MFYIYINIFEAFPGKHSSDINGLYLINDGYQTVCALLELQKECQSGAVDGEVPDNVAEVWDKGVLVDLKAYLPGYSRDTHVAWMTLLHDQDQNRYRPTSIFQKIAVIERYVQRAPGGCLKHVALLVLTRQIFFCPGPDGENMLAIEVIFLQLLHAIETFQEFIFCS